MAIKLFSGDLFLFPDLKAFAHGCNCAGAMGAGIALEFKKRWPNMYKKYRSNCQYHVFRPGKVMLWEEDGYTIFNLGTQKSWKTNAKLHYISSSVFDMMAGASFEDIKEIGMPMIGAGLGRLRWDGVLELLGGIAEDVPEVDLLIVTEFIPGKIPELISAV